MSSSDYRVLSGRDEARQLLLSSGGWLAARTVARQERAYRGLIADMKRGRPRIDFEVAAKAIAATGIRRPRVIEIGCGTGSYSEVLATLLSGAIDYRGMDYSEAMIARARIHHPGRSFDVGDATRLPYGNRSFEIVFNGVALMHIVDYEVAIHEAARVAERYCIFHGVPVFHDHKTTFLTKLAYGAPVIEVIFGKRELLSICNKAGLLLEAEWPGIPYDMHEVTGHHSMTETYLFAVSQAPRR
ncbi:class I SAM-dependent methyltransferase [Bradyrhizobium sp. ISRA442]|uniref:class I SAM-dependent methyltransferase n=1 Tax=Bradyrhizobium sp. ISRA442 TaxID=2866197 RepID=UPI00311B1384